MSNAPMVVASAAETWLREALTRLLLELSLFARTFAAFAIRPGRAARAWQTGEQSFMNPLGFAATAAGVYWATVSVLAAVWPIPGPDTTAMLAEQLTAAVGPYLHYGLLGIVMHFGLRGLGSRRPVLGSIGISFFAGGSIGTAAALLLTATARWFGHVRGTASLELSSGDPVPLALLLAAVSAYALLCLVMARAMMGLHRAAGWKAVLAAVLATVVTALLFGSVLPDGSYGWRPYLHIDPASAFALSFGFRA